MGHEFDVLKGGAESLSMVELVQFEFGGTNIDSRTFFRDLWYFLTEIGFEIYRVSPNGLIHISHYSSSDECFAYSIFLRGRGRFKLTKTGFFIKLEILKNVSIK